MKTRLLKLSVVFNIIAYKAYEVMFINKTDYPKPEQFESPEKYNQNLDKYLKTSDVYP